jgi:hypothetical protein
MWDDHPFVNSYLLLRTHTEHTKTFCDDHPAPLPLHAYPHQVFIAPTGYAPASLIKGTKSSTDHKLHSPAKRLAYYQDPLTL